MKKYPFLLLVTVVVLGWLFDFLFWEHPLGINFAIYLTLCLLAGLGLLLANGHKPAWKSLLLLLPFAFFVAITFIRREQLTRYLAYTFTLFLLALMAVTYLGGRWTRYSLFDYIYKFTLLAIGMLIHPRRYRKEARQEFATAGEKVKAWPYKRILRGVLLAIPVVTFFTLLLSSADMVFNQKLTDFFDRFDVEDIPEYALRLIIIFSLAYALLGIFLHAAERSTDETLLGENKPVLKRFLHFTETAIVLGSVVILFIIFVIIQFQYFFGGEGNIGVAGYTYSQYARSGFNELIWVALCSLVMSLGLSTITRRETNWQKRVYSGLSVALMGLVLVILVSAYQRLTLAIDWHGFSRLRLYPRVFLIWVGILFIAVIVLEVIRRERYFALAAVVASIGFAVTLSLVNVDASIVRHNAYRTLEGKHFNVNHLTTLSADAVPALAEAYLDRSLPVETRDGLGAALVCFLNSELYVDYPDQDWQSFTYAQWAAVKALEEVEPRLDSYLFNDRIYPYLVETPRHMLYECAVR
jgi:hypothetical protein